MALFKVDVKYSILLLKNKKKINKIIQIFFTIKIAHTSFDMCLLLYVSNVN